MDEVKKLHGEILDKVREYYRLAHAPQKEAPFIPGESRIN